MSWGYLWLFRGTPLLVQIFFVYFAVPQLTGQRIVLSEFWSAMLALSLNEGAYMAEIIRAGILSVDAGQVEAAESLGMTRSLTMRRIILPQAVRIIIPPTGNEFISMLKNTSLAYAISAHEIFFSTDQLRSATFKEFEPLTIVSVWYLATTTVASYLQGHLERYFARVCRARSEIPAFSASHDGDLPARMNNNLQPMVQVEDLHKRFGALEVLRGIDMTVGKGETVVIIGASGSGKSTFLRCINSLEAVDRGRVVVDGTLVGYREDGARRRPLPPRVIARQRASIGMVFQRFNLFPHMTALQNVTEAPFTYGVYRDVGQLNRHWFCSTK
jgi:polar amino acid transport system permease protein